MRRRIVAGLSVLTVVVGVGWKLASHPATSVGLQAVQLSQHSEHANAGSTNAMAGIRIRLSGSDFGYAVRATDRKVPQISVAE
jgi:hypothetical protein